MNLQKILIGFLSHLIFKIITLLDLIPPIVWCLTKFMLTTTTDFDTALVMDKNNSMDIVSVCKPHCNTHRLGKDRLRIQRKMCPSF